MAFLLLHNYTDFIYIKALSEFFDLEHTFIQETLNKLAERPKTDTQLNLFSYDTG